MRVGKTLKIKRDKKAVSGVGDETIFYAINKHTTSFGPYIKAKKGEGETH